MNLVDIATNQLHYKRLREDPIYCLQCELDDMRMEMEPAQWGLSGGSEGLSNLPKPESEPEWTKRQWDYILQLKAQVLFLSDKVNEMRASASKRKAKIIKPYKGVDIEA